MPATLKNTLALAAAAIALTGCYGPGGPGYSADMYTYVSDEWHPYTITLFDSRTGEALWSVDVPVGQQLVMRFNEGMGPNQFKPDLMAWGLMESGRRTGPIPNNVPVPGPAVRRVEMKLRPTPEMPGALTAPVASGAPMQVYQPPAAPAPAPAQPARSTAPAPQPTESAPPSQPAEPPPAPPEKPKDQTPPPPPIDLPGQGAKKPGE